MFIILITFKKPLEILNQHLESHRIYLDTCYQKNYLIASGQNKDQTGGVMISQLTNKLQLENIIKQDPLYQKNIIDYEITEFTATKYHALFTPFIESSA